jgi:hypothetical protein
MNEEPPPPREYSPDGKWVWDGSEWQPNPESIAPTRPTSPYGTSTSWAVEEPPKPLAPPAPPGPPTRSAATVATVPVRAPAATYTLARPTAAPPASLQAVDNTFAWLLAATPLVALVVEVILGVIGSRSDIPFAVGLCVLAFLAIADARRVRAAGFEASAVLAVILVPAYLFVRSSKLRNGYAIPLAWCAAFAIFVGGFLVLPQALGVRIDSDFVEQSIATGIEDRAGISLVVACPEGISVRPGGVFSCTATATDGSQITIDVTVQNTQGDFTWDVHDAL